MTQSAQTLATIIRLWQDLGRPPTEKEIAIAMDADHELTRHRLRNLRTLGKLGPSRIPVGYRATLTRMN